MPNACRLRGDEQACGKEFQGLTRWGSSLRSEQWRQQDVSRASHAASPGQEFDISPAILRVLEGVERGLASSDSRRAYGTALLQFIRWCSSGKGDGMFSRLSVLQYKDELIGSGSALKTCEWKRRYASATVYQRLAAIRAIAQEAADVGLIDQNGAAAIRRIRGEKQSRSKIGNRLQKSQVDAVLNSVDCGSVRGKRDYAILAFLFATALRRRELVMVS